MGAEYQPGGPAADELRGWLKKVRFRKALIGGVNEADVWKKIAELQKLYETALTAERLRYDALLAEQRGGASAGASARDAPAQAAGAPQAGRTADEG